MASSVKLGWRTEPRRTKRCSRSFSCVVSIPPLYQTLVETEHEAWLTKGRRRAHFPLTRLEGAIMPKGVRGSGTLKPKRLSPEEARQERERLQAQLAALEAQDAQRYAIIGR